jgi:GNAT superfamily N-acetyltransferase
MERPRQTTTALTLRHASEADAALLAALITAAYRVEDFFVTGDRIDTDEVIERMRHGRFLVLEDGAALAGCVYVRVNGDTGYFGLLSTDPSRQRQGIGGRLIAAAEDACRVAGCGEMEIEVVNLRAELPPFYRRFGYSERGVRPFPDADRATRRCHFIVMRKPL